LHLNNSFLSKSLKRPTHGGNLVWAGAIANCPTSSIKDFSASINPLGPPESAIIAIHEGVNFLSSYPDPNYSQYCASLANHHNITPEFILPGNGVAELLTWAAWELCKLKVTYIPNPGFADYKRALDTFSSTINFYQLDHLINLKEDFKFPQNAGLIINNPHNPTGKLWLIDEILPLLKQFALVVIDEAFMDFLLPSQQQSLIPFVHDFDNLIILRSLTKFYSVPGLRLGYVISQPERIKRWQKWRDPWSVNVLASLVGEKVVKDFQFQQKTWNWLIPTRKKLYEELSSLSYLKPLPSSANFLLVETEKSSQELQLNLLKKYGIFIRDCLSFKSLGDRFFRIAIRTEEENNTLLNALINEY
jgi:L-threonine-O-3-phosphate decarboxylase